MKNRADKPIETALTISTGLLILFLVTQQEWLVGIAIAIGLIGLISPFLSQKIHYLWMQLAGLLAYMMPKILLSIIFFGLLCPIAFLARVFGKKDPLQLKNTTNSTFIKMTKQFDPSHFEKPW